MDTVTLIRSAIRGLFKVAEPDLVAALRAVLSSGDDYASSAKPQIDWDDSCAREALIDCRTKDASACLLVLDGEPLGPALSEAAALLATVVGQDTEEDGGGVFRIVRGVASDRVVSTVDPEARHGHKTQAKGFDGYKGPRPGGPGLRDHHRDGGDPGQCRRRRRGRGAHRRSGGRRAEHTRRRRRWWFRRDAERYR